MASTRKCTESRNVRIPKRKLAEYKRCCEEMDPMDVCIYLFALREWSIEVHDYITTRVEPCLVSACGGGTGSGVPSEPPPWPPK